MEKILTVLLIEDDVAACNAIENYIDACGDIQLCGITNDSLIALEMTTSRLPDAIILDLELHIGGGNGFDFLKGLNELSLPSKPYILITTHNSSNLSLEHARRLGADFIIAKYESRYSAQYVVEFLRMLQEPIFSKRIDSGVPLHTVSQQQKEKSIIQRIQRELDFVGVNSKNLGYQYLTDAILILITKNEVNLSKIIAQKYKKSDVSVERAMQNAINRAWRTCDIEDLEFHYTAKIRSDKGVPTTMEFVHYYAKEIRNDL